MAEYTLRLPFSQEKRRYQANTGTVIYRSKMHPVLKRHFEVVSACDGLAAFTAHLPHAVEHLVRYSGWDHHGNRGKRRKTPGEDPSPIEEVNEVSRSTAKRAWARLIKQVYVVDPLCCGSAMRIIAFLEEPVVYEKILTHPGPWLTLVHSPPVAGYPLPCSLQRVLAA